MGSWLVGGMGMERGLEPAEIMERIVWSRPVTITKFSMLQKLPCCKSNHSCLHDERTTA